jgi:hypothetical protein
MSLSGKIAVGIHREKKHEQVERGAKKLFHGELARLPRRRYPENGLLLTTLRES